MVVPRPPSMCGTSHSCTSGLDIQECTHLLSHAVTWSLPTAVNSIALVKPDKARMVESMLIQMAQTGQLQGKVVSHDCHVTFIS